MATNYIQEGKSMYLVTESGAKSGNPFVVGDYLPCVLLTDADAADKATVATEGVFSLSVDGVTPGAVSAGDMLYWTAKDAVLSKDSTGKPFGIALEATTHATAAIKVMLNPKATIPAAVGAGDIEAGTLAADETGRALMATDYFNAATVAAKFGTDSLNIANALDIIEAEAIVTALIADANVTLAKLHVNEVARYIPREITAPSDAGTLTATTSGFVSWTTPTSSAVTANLAVPQFLGQELTLILGTRTTSGDLEVTVAESLSLNSSNRKITFNNEGEWIKLAATDVGSALRWVEVAKGGASVGAV